MDFTLSDQYHDPIRWEHFVRSDDVKEDILSKITNSSSETNPSKYYPSRFRNPTHMIKVSNCHQLMSCHWQIITSYGLDGISEDKISKISKSDFKNNTSKSKRSRLRNPTYIIKVESYHQLMYHPCHIFTSEGLNTGQEIDSILQKTHLPNSSSRDFEKFYKGQKNQIVIRMAGQIIYIFYSYIFGLT